MKLTSAEHDSDHNDKLFNNIRKYQRMVGKLLYLTNTRPDIVFVVQTISQYMQKPKQSHWNATLRVIRYIKGNPELGLLMTSHKDFTLTRYCNAGWVACLDTRRSFTEYMLKFGGFQISWKSKKQNRVLRSFAEAEYRSLATLTTEMVWVTNLFKESKVALQTPSIVHCDSKAAIQIATNLEFNERTKHIEINYYFIREKVQQGLIKNKLHKY